MFTNIISTSRSQIKFKEIPRQSIGESKPRLHPWQVLDYSPEREQAIYVGWGRHCAWQQQMRLAENYFNRALDIQPRDPKALYSRSSCKRSLAQPMEAFEDSLKATYLEPLNSNINQEFCYTLYELNEFETALGEAKNIMRKCGGPYQRTFDDFCNVILENLCDILGDSAGYFFIKNGKLCLEVLQEFKRKNSLSKRPIWKILKEQNECDVESLRVKKTEPISPLENARRERALKVFYQRYLERSWIDVLTLRDFPNCDVLLAKAFKESTPKLRELLKTQNKAIKKFGKMLHVRRPMYCELNDRMKRMKLWERYYESHLYMIQYQTLRNMFLILRNIRHLRNIGAIEKLSQYVERAMGDYIVQKTYRIAPWKFEFMSDVYNLLALAYADTCVIPPNFDPTQRDALEKFLNLPLPTDFGIADKESFQPKEKKEKSLEGFKSFLKRMEKRLLFSKNSIEKAYIYHEIARSQFKNNFMNDSASIAAKGYLEAMNCNHGLYAYLCTLLVARALASNFKTDKSLMEITKLQNLASHLRSEQLLEYTDYIKMLIETKIADKKIHHKLGDKKRSRQRSSLHSSGSSSNPSSSSYLEVQSTYRSMSFRRSSEQSSDSVEIS